MRIKSRASIRLSRDFSTDIRAIRSLLLFGIGTSLGYLIYQAFLPGINAAVLTVNTFFWLFVFFSFGPNDRYAIWQWRNIISLYTLRYSLCQFAYWYAFWTGITHSDSSLALSMLALTMICTPLIVRNIEAPENRLPYYVIVLTGIVLVISAVLVDIDASLLIVSPSSRALDAAFSINPDLESNLRFNPDLFNKLIRIDPYPVLCMIIAVVAESLSDRVCMQVPRAVKQQYVVFLKEYKDILLRTNSDHFSQRDFDAADAEIRMGYGHTTRIAGQRNIISKKQMEYLEKVVAKDVVLKSVPIMITLSVIMLVIHGNIHFPESAVEFGDWMWFLLWMFILATVGSSAKVLFIVPLEAQKIRSGAIPPIFAGRQIIFYFLAAICALVCHHFLDGISACGIKYCSVFDHIRVRFDVVPEGHSSYWFGVSTGVSVLLLYWSYFIRSGFFDWERE